MDALDYPRVLVTFRADDGLRALVGAALDDVASVSYLDDVADERRGAELRRAEILLSWVPGGGASRGRAGQRFHGRG